MRILLVGASSYVGARIYQDLKKKYELIGTYNTTPLFPELKKLDSTNQQEIVRLIDLVKPDIIIHVANFASARIADNNENVYTAVNLKSTEYLVKVANRVKAKFIFISSFAAENTTDIYGRLKAESETLTRRCLNGYLIIRPSLIVGYSPNTKNDRPFNRILRCIDDQTKMGEFDTSWKFLPTYLGNLSQVIDQAISKNVWNIVIPVITNKIVNQYQLASDILKHFSIKVKAIDKKVSIPMQPLNTTPLEQFDLYPSDYKDMIDTIVQEIKVAKNL